MEVVLEEVCLLAGQGKIHTVLFKTFSYSHILILHEQKYAFKLAQYLIEMYLSYIIMIIRKIMFVVKGGLNIFAEFC